MNSKPLLAFLLLITMAFAMMAAEASKVHDFRFYDALVGDVIGDDNEMLMDSEANRRTLVARGRGGRGRYIAYRSLQNNQVPCGNRGRSYYNCYQRGRANPYRRGCTKATHCQRSLD